MSIVRRQVRNERDKWNRDIKQNIKTKHIHIRHLKHADIWCRNH
jgi:hypothetical protein